MKNISRVFGLSALLFLTVLVHSASASTTNLSSDPAYAEGPFLFWCEPYVRSFKEGKHYQPANGPCKYSIPNTILGNKRIALYKGTVGSSTLVTGDAVVFSPTLVRQNFVSFVSMVQEQPLFAVVFDSALNEGGVAFDTYLRTGCTPPVAAVEDQNYYTLPWVWGAKPVEEFEPVLVVPDILNSWETDTGFVLDPVFNTYSNLLDTLAANGYVEGQTLFTLPYNWEESYTSLSSAIESTLASIKSTCGGCAFVDVITHGASSLAVSHYIESAGYPGDIDQVVFVAPPFNGVPAAYAAWEAGLVQFDEPLRNGVAQALLAHRAEEGGFTSVFDYVQNSAVPSFNEILPASTYLSGKSYPTDYPVNSFLANMQTDFGDVFDAVQIHQFASDSGSSATPDTFTIVPSTNPPLWPHGEVTVTQFSTGDGMVPYFSAEFFVSSDVYLTDISHQALPTEAESHIFEALNNAPPSTVINNPYPPSCVLFLTVSAGTDLQITDPNSDRLGKDFDGGGNFAEIARSVYSGPGSPAEYLAVANPIDGTYAVKTQGNINGSFTLTATDVCNDGTNATSTTATTTPGQIVGYDVTINPDDTISIEPLDVGAPVVTINSPANGATYLSTETVAVSVTISDPESSPLAQTTYHLNGAPVYPLQPLPLSSQPLGTAVFVVVATDVFGNVGQATSTFTIEEPPLSVPTDKNQCKKGGWKNLVDDEGNPFKNRGDCVSFVSTDGKNKADTKEKSEKDKYKDDDRDDEDDHDD